LNEALAQFRASSKSGGSASAAHQDSDRPVPAGAAR
jgi:hypothetical protein